MALVVVERTFEEPMKPETAEERERAVAWCLETYGVVFKYTYWSPDGTRAICVYEAPDAEAVRKVQRQSGLPYDRVWTADRFPE